MIIYGVNPVKDLFKKDISKIKNVWINKKRHQSFYNELISKKINTNDISLLNYKNFKLTGNENIQGIVAEVDDPIFYNLKDIVNILKENNNSKILILDHIIDPQNFGSIIRNASAFNIDLIIFPSRNCAKINPTVIKASSGNWIHVKFCEVNSIISTIEFLKKNNFWIVSTILNGKNTLSEIKELKKPLVIILGNEGKGISKVIIEKSDFKVKINMNENVESLNVSSIAAIILHELYKK